MRMYILSRLRWHSRVCFVLRYSTLTLTLLQRCSRCRLCWVSYKSVCLIAVYWQTEWLSTCRTTALTISAYCLLGLNCLFWPFALTYFALLLGPIVSSFCIILLYIHDCYMYLAYLPVLAIGFLIILAC